MQTRASPVTSISFIAVPIKINYIMGGGTYFQPSYPLLPSTRQSAHSTESQSNASRPANATGNNDSIRHQQLKRLSSGQRTREQRQPPATQTPLVRPMRRGTTTACSAKRTTIKSYAFCRRPTRRKTTTAYTDKTTREESIRRNQPMYNKITTPYPKNRNSV